MSKKLPSSNKRKRTKIKWRKKQKQNKTKKNKNKKKTKQNKKTAGIIFSLLFLFASFANKENTYVRRIRAQGF